MSKKIVSLKEAVYMRLTCANRDCTECDVKFGGCGELRRAIERSNCIPLYTKGTAYDVIKYPSPGIDVIAVANGKKIIAHVIYDGEEPMAWQNAAFPDDMYMLSEVTDWAYAFIGDLEVEVKE